MLLKKVMMNPKPVITPILCAIFLFVASSTVRAEFGVHGLFCNHAVLQRDCPIPVWGKVAQGETVTVTLGKVSVSTQGGDGGSWLVHLPQQPAASGLTMVVSSGDEKVVIDDVSVGEVWLGSGQSNMEMKMKNGIDFDKETQTSDHPQIRFFTVGGKAASQPRSAVEGNWEVSSPETVGQFSAVSYHFAKALQQELDVPIGMIVSSVGGTPIQAWTDLDAQKSVAELAPLLKILHQRENDPELKSKLLRAYQKKLDRWNARVATAKAAGEPSPKKPRRPKVGDEQKKRVAGLFNGKIAPLVPYAIRGVIWYQGEGNSFPDIAQYYQYQLPTLIHHWRKIWNQNDLPFAWVQLPNYGTKGRDWPTVRQAMLHSLRIPNTGMAISIDVGDSRNIHPKDKKVVSQRLARWALATVYGQDITPMGPIPQSVALNGNAVDISFQYTSNGLRWIDNSRKTGFEIQDAKGQWLPATAELIDQKTVRVVNSSIPSPTAVRYLWANDPKATLESDLGIPASPLKLTVPAAAR